MFSVEGIRAHWQVILGVAAAFAVGIALGIGTHGGSGRTLVPVVVTETVTVPTLRSVTPPRRPASHSRRRLPSDPLSRIDDGAWAF